jgi:hypothetical protein
MPVALPPWADLNRSESLEAGDDGTGHYHEQLFIHFALTTAVPEDHPVRKIAAVLDLSWVHSEIVPFYRKMGRPSIDPELMIRMLAAPSTLLGTRPCDERPGCLLSNATGQLGAK